MFDTSPIVSSLTAAGFDKKQAAAITDAVRKVAATSAVGDITADLMTELVESRYTQRRSVFYRWLVGAMIAAFALGTIVVENQLTAAIARIDLAAERANNIIDDATEASVAVIAIAKNTAIERFGYTRQPVAFESANPLELGRQRRVAFQAGRSEHFEIRVPENDRYCIDAVPDVGPDEADPVMYLYSGRARLNQVAYNDDRDPTSLDSRICENLVRYETYYLEVRELRNRPATVWLSLNLADAL